MHNDDKVLAVCAAISLGGICLMVWSAVHYGSDETTHSHWVYDPHIHAHHAPVEPVSTEQLAQWGYHREGGVVKANDDRLTVHVDGTVTDFHGDYVGRIELKTP
jgi:hypothetical protein